MGLILGRPALHTPDDLCPGQTPDQAFKCSAWPAPSAGRVSCPREFPPIHRSNRHFFCGADAQRPPRFISVGPTCRRGGIRLAPMNGPLCNPNSGCDVTGPLSASPIEGVDHGNSEEIRYKKSRSG